MNVICKVPLAPVRLSPDHRSEMSSQMLFGETAKVIESVKGGWLLVKNSWDGYTGWCRENQFFTTEEPGKQLTLYSGGWNNNILLNGERLIIPYGSNLSMLKNPLPGIHLEFKDAVVNATNNSFDEKTVREIATIFLNTSYLWGGRSVFGIDCSGFVQSVFRMLDIPLLRDAREQVSQGHAISLEESTWGDLAFFKEEDCITHVGLLLGDNKIIHASGQVRIDKLDHTGIIHTDTGIRSHELDCIRRVVIR